MRVWGGLFLKEELRKWVITTPRVRKAERMSWEETFCSTWPDPDAHMRVYLKKLNSATQQHFGGFPHPCIHPS